MYSMKFFRPPNFFKLPEQFQKLVAFLLPIFGNVDGSWRVNYEVPRLSNCTKTLAGVPKIFSKFGTSLVQVGVQKPPFASGGFFGGC